MIRTKQDFDHVVALLRHPNVERRVRLRPHGPEIDAVVSNHQLYVASYGPQGVRWVLVQRDYLADGVHRVQPSSPHPLSGGRTHTVPHSIPPAMPLTFQAHAPSASRLDAACIAAHTPSRWDASYIEFLVDQSHHWYAANNMPSFVQSQTGLQHPPRQQAPAQMLATTIQAIDAQPLQTVAAATPRPIAPRKPAPHSPPASQNPSVAGQQNLDSRSSADGADTSAPVQVATKRPKKTAKRVDAATGKATSDPNATLIPSQTEFYRRLVDPNTGKPATSDTVQPISRRRYYYMELQRRMVDAQTGLPATAATSETVSYHQFRRRQLVDADTGLIATDETTHKITRSAYQSRKVYASRKDKDARAI